MDEDPNKPPFKVGDRVRIFSMGSEGTIREVGTRDTYRVRFTHLFGGFTEASYFGDELELIQDEAAETESVSTDTTTISIRIGSTIVQVPVGTPVTITNV